MPGFLLLQSHYLLFYKPVFLKIELNMAKYITGLNKTQNNNLVLGTVVFIVVYYIIFNYKEDG